MNKKPLETLFNAMYHGKQSFQDFATCDVAQRVTRKTVSDNSAKERIVYAADKVLVKYHSFLNLFIFNHLPIREDIVFSYRKGTNAADAVKKHVNSRHFYQADIANFFPSISADSIKKAILRGVHQVPVSDVAEYLDRIIDLVTVESALPLGFATSPSISNTALLLFDDALSSVCLEKGLVYTRYSDDITISAQEKESLLGMDATITRLLAECDYPQMHLNDRKTKLTSIGRKIKILGMVILPNGQLTVDSKIRNRVETMLHFYVRNNDALVDLTNTDLDESVDVLGGLVNYVNTIDQKYLDKLRRRYGVTVIDTLIHRQKNTDSKRNK
ncbi:reverse transcriptase domain-containing protein [Paraburkholderia sp. BCC1885]|uniref:reverse transcriptase domain-containing protein n=1 Tax=Paraburkholderia sp. BCC1885 TaxID=2562669 RepID=UPI001183CCB7|nr:reverse transcriptase domain-containing protein [Paraburkholderia sp. BCC1885]